MSYLRDRVFVLKKEPFREHDRRYVMYGCEHGLLTAVARGASLLHSKQAGHLEPFSEAEVMIAHGSAFDKLAVAKRLIHSEKEVVPFNLAVLSILGAVADLVFRLSRPGIPDPRIFNLLSEARLTVLPLSTEPTPLRARLILAGFTLKFLDLLGFAPSFENARELLPQAITLLHFLRRFPLADSLRITVSTDVLVQAAQFIEDAVRHTPLEKPPHGPLTVQVLLN